MRHSKLIQEEFIEQIMEDIRLIHDMLIVETGDPAGADNTGQN